MKINAILKLAAVLPLVFSCDKMLEPKKTGEVEDDRMWVVPEMAQGVLMQAYSAMPGRPDTFDNNFLDAATDNAVTNSFNSSVYRVGLGLVSSSNAQIGVWSSCYDQFQNIHLFLEKGLTERTKYDLDEDVNKEKKRQLEAEAYYLRAWWGFRLLQYYGGRAVDGRALGYPVVTEYISPEMASDFSWIRRNTYEECVEQICRDCDKASENLPAAATGQWVGRATSLMAEFLKARVLLYAASPAYQPASVVSIEGPGKFSILDPEIYASKWERVVKQAWKVMKTEGFGNYSAIKYNDMVDVSDANMLPGQYVFRYYFNSNGMETRHYPPYYFGSCNTTPSQNLVDAYPMKANGYPIDREGSGYDRTNPYAGRDNRLDMTIYHQGSKFGDNDSYIDVVYGGKDSEAFMNSGSRASRTGYYLAKFMSRRADFLNPVQSQNSIHLYSPMRKAEIFFIFAEASNELYGPTVAGEGMDRSAYDILKEIRKKSGGVVNDLYIEEIKGDKDKFRVLVQNERRLEFAFENFRFWDLRRCLLPLDEDIRGVTVTRGAEKGMFFYDTDKKVESRPMKDIKYYWLPVPYDEMKKNPDHMVNNYGY